MYKNLLSDNISKKSLSSQSHKEYHLHFLVESRSFIVTGLIYRFMIHIELIFVYNVRNKNGGVPPSPQIPSQLCQCCFDSFQLGSSKAPVWQAMETELGSSAKESILWLKNEEARAQALEPRLSWKDRTPAWLLLGMLAVGEGQVPSSQLLRPLQIPGPGTVSLHAAQRRRHLELTCHGQHFCTRSWSWGVSSAILQGTLSGLKCWAPQLCAGTAHLMC